MNTKKKERFSENHQVCNVCTNDLPIENFEWLNNRPNPRKTCKGCRGKKQWERIKNLSPELKEKFLISRRPSSNKYRKKNGNYLRKYGITKEDKLNMISNQESRCLICGDSINDTIGHVDHSHQKGHIRGILCSSCNFGLGFFKDKIENLEKAIQYLKEREYNPHFEVH